MAALQGLAPSPRIFYLGTFSKSTYADIRIGDVVVPEALIEIFELAQRQMGMLTSIAMQDALAEFISAGASRPHQKDDASLQGTARPHAAGARQRSRQPAYRRSAGRGMQLLARCHGAANDRKLSARLLEAGVVSRALSSMLYHRTDEQGLFRASPRGMRRRSTGLRACSAASCVKAASASADRRLILRDGTCDHLVDGKNFAHARDAMPRAPDILPAFWAVFARADIDVLADIDRATLRQVVGIEAGGLDRGPQHVGLQSRKRRGQQNVVGAAGDEHLLVARIRHALAGRDELGAHVGEVAAERLGGAQRVAVGDPPASTRGPSKNARTARTNTKGLSQPVWPPAPAVSSTSPSAPAATARSAWRIEATSAKTSAPASCNGSSTGAGDPRGNDHLGPVPQQHLQILLQPRVGAMHDQVGADRCRGFAACIGMLLQPAFDLRQPFVELFGAAAVHRWKRTDHPVAACGYHKLDPETRNIGAAISGRLRRSRRRARDRLLANCFFPA